MAGTTQDRPTGAERAAAVCALVALPLALVIIAIGVTTSIGGVVVVLVGIALLTVGGWYVVARRGAGRTLGLLLALGGLVVAVAGLIWADLKLVGIASSLVLVVVSVAAAQYALRRTTRALKEAPVEGVAGAPAKHPVLLMNPKSGGGKVDKFNLVEECKKRGIEPIVLDWSRGDDLEQVAEDAVARGADMLGMAGGDGSQALVATVARKHGLSHVVVPAGTRNHLALDLGLDRDDVVGALDAYADGVEREVDLAKVNGRIFVNNASLGLYAKIVQSPEYRDAKMKTAADMLPDMLGPDAEPLDIRYRGPDGEEHATAHMLLVSNNPYQLDRLGGQGTRPRMDLGVLGVAALTVTGATDVRRLIALETAGQLRKFPGWVEWSAPRFQIDSAGPVEVGIDGEAMTLDPPLVFETIPGAITVRLPQHAIGLSPAARRMDRSSIRELLDVAKGEAV